MLETQSYITAVFAYSGAALLALVVMFLWLRSSGWSRWSTACLFWLGAAVLLTPAYASPEVETFAPAIIVAVFQSAFSGLDQAQHAIRPLLTAVVFGLGIGLLHTAIWALWGRRTRESV